MLVFIDVEASSLRNGFPVEVAWCAADLKSAATYLIRPEPTWWDRFTWSAEAEGMHGLDRAILEECGVPAAQVAERLLADLTGADVQSDNPAYDVGWLSVLFSGDPPFMIGQTRPAGAPMLSSDIGLRKHRALDDAVALAMAFKAFETDHQHLDPDSAEDMGRALLERYGRG